MSKKPIRVLLIDDDRDDYFLVRELFADVNGSGYALDWAPDYDAALEAICRGEHDVYLLDYRLGRRTGLDLLREARAKGCLGPVIMLTGQGERDVDVAAMEAGAADYLDKGRLDAALLERAVRYALQQRRHEAELERRVEERTAELARATEALQEADRRKNDFLAMLAHELRNPLAPVRNAIQILKLKGPADPDLQWAREVIERQVQMMTRLVDDLLDVSRITRGKLKLHKESVDAATVVARAVEMVRPLADARKHELTVSLPEGPLWLEADPPRLAQVVANLLTNAAKYTDEGGQIWLTVEQQGDEAVVRVKDTGVGIAADLLPRVFEPFTQEERSLDRAQGGLGIGLTMARSLVELHGGSVQGYSEGLGKGSEFVVCLPLLKKATAPTAAKPKPGAARQVPARRILVVDDNRDSAESLALLLRFTGHEVQTAYEGEAALETARTQRPDVVLLDIGLPRMDGLEVAHRLRHDLALTDALLVALTGYGQEEDRRRSERAGFNAHLVKPVDLDALYELMVHAAIPGTSSLPASGGHE